ncbi:MAG: hypothetical protein ACXADH_01445 [Candidatus Kariarchaeaceae archaeon]
MKCYNISTAAVCVIIILTFTTSTSADTSFTGKTHLSYTVTTANTGINSWVNPDYSPVANYTINNSSTIDVEVPDIHDPVSNLNITIGNFTREFITDGEAELSLTLGHYLLPNRFGFLANTSWNDVRGEFNKIEWNTSSFQTNLRDTYLGGEIEVVLVSFSDGFQTTTLVYEKAHGVLLLAKTEVGNFFIEFQITTINTNPKYFAQFSDENTLATQFVPIIISFLLVMGVTNYKRNRN